MIQQFIKLFQRNNDGGRRRNFLSLVLVHLVFVSVMVGCEDIQQGQPQHDSGKKTVRIDSPSPDPLQHALSILGLQPADLVRPLSHEEGYQIVGRTPLIDQLAKSPFYLHHWADETSDKLQYNTRRQIAEALSFTLMSINGGVSYKHRLPTEPDEPTTIGAYRELCRRYDVIPDNAEILKLRQAELSHEFDRQLGRLIYALTASSLMANEAVAGLSTQELSYLVSRPERYFYPRGHQFSFLTAATHTQTHILSITRKIDYVALYTAALCVARALDRFQAYVNTLEDTARSDHFFSGDGPRAGINLEIFSPIGRIVIGGQDRNVYSGRAALIIDLGGNDRYTGPVAVGHLLPGRVSIAVDLGGNDLYSPSKDLIAQGTGCLAVGMLLDLSGDDRYVAGDIAQGAGIYGVGILADSRGNDYYRMGSMGQGFGVFGVGMLLDRDGNDKYMMTAMGQGAGSTLGCGVLCDLKGNDKYLAEKAQQQGKLIPDNLSHVQGAGLSVRSPDWSKHPSIYGGVGFLSDGAGNDFYFASNGNSMGSSYFMSVGALADHDGNDKYIPGGGYGLAYAVHLSNAVFIDRSGNDYYFAKTHSGGVGSDRSTAIMADYAGNDIYGPSIDYVRKEIEKELNANEIQLSADDMAHRIQQRLADVSFGSALKPKALGFLIDYQGNDRYFARKNGWGESLGGIMPPASPQNWNHALLLDLGGDDLYFAENRKNNHYTVYYQHGLCYDTEYGGRPNIGKEPFPEEKPKPYQFANAANRIEKSTVANEIKKLSDPDLFVRYASIGKITRHVPDIGYELIALLAISKDQRLNQDIIESFNAILLSGRIHLRQLAGFESLLQAVDPLVRRYAARKLGWSNLVNAAAALAGALEEKNDDVRADIIWALGRTGSVAEADLLADRIQTDPSLSCRRSAVFALGYLADKLYHRKSFRQQKYARVLLDALDQSDEIVKTYAAAALVNFAEQSEVTDALEKLLGDNSVYVRRAAAKALILNNHKKGIPVLIRTLQFPSIDTFEHYDHELAKDLAYFTGVDFPENQRYQYLTWQNWWQKNSSELNLKQNLAIMKRIQRAFEASNEEKGIAIFEGLEAQYPDNLVIKRRYRRFCYEWITFRLLTHAQITRNVLERCLRLQKIKANLEPENSQTLASLAYFYARLQHYDQAVIELNEAIRLDPQNSGYRKILKLYVDRQKRVGKADGS
jgi:HEAT repeat protein